MKKCKLNFDSSNSCADVARQEGARSTGFIAKLFLSGFLFAGLVMCPTATRATMILGNLPTGGSGYDITTSAGNTFGIAVEFTSLKDVSFSSVTLWVSGYTGLNGSDLFLSVLNDNSAYGLPYSGPAATLVGASTAPNNGANAPLTFNVGGQLKANTPYWLFLYLQIPGGGAGMVNGNVNCYWDAGGNLIGNGLVNGSEPFDNGFVHSSFQAEAPAFAFNSVPEQASTALLLIMGTGGCCLVRHYQRRRVR